MELADQFIEKEDQNASNQFFQRQNNQLITFLPHWERFCYVLLVFDSNSAKYGLISMKSSLLPLLVKDIEIELIVFKKANLFEFFKEANQFESLKFRDHQFLDILNFLGGATCFD